MPIVSEPKTNEEVKPQVETPEPAEPELFAAEIAMEKSSFNFLPVLLIAALVLVVGGFVYWFIQTTREVLSVPEATATVNDILRAQGPAITHFTTGTVDPDNGQQDPQYKLLSKAGVVLTKPKAPVSLLVSITGPGENLLSNIEGVQKVKKQSGNIAYSLPLAERKLVSIDHIVLLKPHLAKVDYTWKWVPNRLGREYDASGELIQSFSTWERSVLIKSYGVDFYSAAPAKASVVLVKANDGPWEPYRE